jgi:hypothetical protein
MVAPAPAYPQTQQAYFAQPVTAPQPAYVVPPTPYDGKTLEMGAATHYQMPYQQPVAQPVTYAAAQPMYAAPQPVQPSVGAGAPASACQKDSASLQCPACHQRSMTTVTHVAGSYTT